MKIKLYKQNKVARSLPDGVLATTSTSSSQAQKLTRLSWVLVRLALIHRNPRWHDKWDYYYPRILEPEVDRTLHVSESADLGPEPGLTDARPWLAPITLSCDSYVYSTPSPLGYKRLGSASFMVLFSSWVPCVKTCPRSK